MIDVTASVTGSVKARSKKKKEFLVDRSSGIKMDSRIGLDYIVENSEYTAKLGSGQSVISGTLLIGISDIKV